LVAWFVAYISSGKVWPGGDGESIYPNQTTLHFPILITFIISSASYLQDTRFLKNLVRQVLITHAMGPDVVLIFARLCARNPLISGIVRGGRLKSEQKRVIEHDHVGC
jgi:hypothetical protein